MPKIWDFDQISKNSYFTESIFYATESKFYVFNIKFDI